MFCGQAFAQGSPAIYYTYKTELDNRIYNPGDTVLIKIEESFNGMQGSPDVPIRIVNGLNYSQLVYNQTVHLVNYVGAMNFTIPKQSHLPVYIINSPTQSDAFFTNKEASRIILSDLDINNTKIEYGKPFSFKLKVTDGLGNPVPNAIVWSELKYGLCEHDTRQWFVDNPVYFHEDNASEGGFVGFFTLPTQLDSGIQWMTLTANVPQVNGYTHDDYAIQFQAVDRDGKKHQDMLGTTTANEGINFQLTGGAQLVELRNHDQVYISGTTAINCTDVIPNIPVDVQLVRLNTYGNRSEQIVETQNTTSDGQGKFGIELPVHSLQPDDYKIRVTAKSQDAVSEQDFLTNSAHNKMNYTVTANGKEFPVFVDAWFSSPDDLTFNESNNALVADLTMEQYWPRVDVIFPHNLMNDTFTFLVNEHKQDLTESNFVQTPDYYHFMLFPKDEHVHLEIIGTKSIPEFPLTMPILLASFVSLIVFYRIKFRR
jgi:hypothetical protein